MRERDVSQEEDAILSILETAHVDGDVADEVMRRVGALCDRLDTAINGEPSAVETSGDETQTLTGKQRWRHLVHCNAGARTPLGGDMCICLRELHMLAETFSASRYDCGDERDAVKANEGQS